MKNLDMQSPNLVSENIEKIAALFPNCVTEGENGKVIDFDVLRQELSNDIVEGNKERYRLEWPGKREAIVTANIPTTKTLRPVREDSVNFDTTENVYIEGDNLEVLKILQESYLGKIKMIYIDPPYNTGKDFVYKDNFRKDSDTELFESGQTDEYNQRLVANPDTAGRYHSDWLTMMYPRLKLARNLLTDDGVIFISIDDNEVHNLRKVCDEVFGEGNFLGIIANVNNPKGRSDDKFIATAHEYLISYGKNVDFTTVHGFEPNEKIIKRYNKEDRLGKKFREIDLRKTGDSDKRVDRPDMFYYFYADSNNLTDLIVSKTKLNLENRIEIIPLKDDNSHGRWRWGLKTAKEKITTLYAKFMPTRKIWGIFEKDYLEGRPPVKSTSSWTFKDVNSERGSEQMIELGFDKETFSRPKPIGTLRRAIEIGTIPSEKSMVLDFYSGSGGICQALFELSIKDKRELKFITVQLPEATDKKSEAYKAGYQNICEIGKERIRRAGKKIIEEQEAEIAKQKAALEKVINGTLAKAEGKYVFPQNAMIDETVDNLLQELNDLQAKVDNLDTGFRVYRVDSSNMKDVYYRPQDITQTLLDNLYNNVKEDRSDEDLLTQVLLDWGLPLSLKIEKVIIADKAVFKIEENSLYACFDKGVDEDFAKAIAKEKPMRIVFKDASFKDDTAKINVEQTLKQLSSETEIKVI